MSSIATARDCSNNHYDIPFMWYLYNYYMPQNGKSQ